MNTALSIRPLAERPETIPSLIRWFEAKWPEQYGPGGRGDAGRDLHGFCSHSALPIGLVGLLDVYCATATATAASLLERARWSFLETLSHDGEQVHIYRKRL